MDFLFILGGIFILWLIFRLYKSMGVWEALEDRNKYMMGSDVPLSRYSQSHSRFENLRNEDKIEQELTLEDLTDYAVGGTARFVGLAYSHELDKGNINPNSCTSLPQLTAETYAIVRSALLARFNGDFNHQDFKMIVLVLSDLRAKHWNGEGRLEDVPYGLLNLVESILTVEAGYDESPASDLETYRFVIVAELAKCGVPEKYILGRLAA